MIEVNGVPAKSSKEIKPGDEITIKRRSRITKVSVTAVPEKKQVSKADAGDLYDIIADEAIADSLP
jgi:ribosomal 50S subunit-recycling heat shock protein